MTISDDLAGDGGSLTCRSLDIKTFTCSSADFSITKTDGVTSVIAGALTYTIDASTTGPNDPSGSTIADTFPAQLTCTWTCAGSG